MRQEAKSISVVKLIKNLVYSLAYVCSLMVLCLASGSISYAQESTNRVDAKTDWSVFIEDQPTKECWVVSKPTKEVTTRNGQNVEVKRSDILLFVTYQPANGINGQVSFTGGYKIDPKKSVELNIDGVKFSLVVDNEHAWLPNDAEDKKVIQALKLGSAAIVSAQSLRSGTLTKDTFSLSGFTAAIAEAEKRCS